MGFEYGRQARDIMQTTALRHMSGETVAQDPEILNFTRTQFDAARSNPEAMPVLIAAHNEGTGRDEDPDLPLALLSLARTRGDAFPIVIDNRSTDDTAEISARMGATLLGAPTGKKVGVTQLGLKYIQEERGGRDALLLDADSFVPPRWAATMGNILRTSEMGNWGVALYGSSLSMHRKFMPIVDTAMCFNSTKHAIKRQLAGTMPIVRGHNYGLRLDTEGRMEAAINALNPDIFDDEDNIIANAIQEGSNARIVGSANPDTFVVTKNDRINTIRQVVDLALNRVTYKEASARSYQQQYGNLRPGNI